MFDLHKNFAASTVAVAPVPPASGTSLTVSDSSPFPAAPFNCTICPAGEIPTPANAEIVRVTVIAGNVLTIQRIQEGTAARTILEGDQIAATITAKTLADVEEAVPSLAHGSQALGSGVSVGIVTGLALGFAPSRAIVSLSRPFGSDFIFASVNVGSVTADGFTFELSAATTSTDFVLDYILLP